MTAHRPFRPMAATLLAAAAALLLTGCFVSPGKFTSELALENDGSFSFRYDGEIFFLGLSKLAQMGAAKEAFEPAPCYDDDLGPRDCTEEEIAQQRTEWDAGAEDRAAKAKKEAEDIAKVLGGIDPSDPAAVEKMRRLLLRHKGWQRVEHKGDGLFDVSYAVAGQLSHDLTFPIIEGIPAANVFVQAILRGDNTVRVNAPAFAVQDNASPFGAMMGGFTGLAALGAGAQEGGTDKGDTTKNLPHLEGTFTVLTNGRILANNTDEGPVEAGGRSRLEWRIDPSTASAPTALIRLGE